MEYNVGPIAERLASQGYAALTFDTGGSARVRGRAGA